MAGDVAWSAHPRARGLNVLGVGDLELHSRRQQARLPALDNAVCLHHVVLPVSNANVKGRRWRLHQLPRCSPDVIHLLPTASVPALERHRLDGRIPASFRDLQAQPAVAAEIVVDGDGEVRRRCALHPPVLDVNAAAAGARLGDLGPGQRLDVHVVGLALWALVCDLDDDGAICGIRVAAARLVAQRASLHALHLEARAAALHRAAEKVGVAGGESGDAPVWPLPLAEHAEAARAHTCPEAWAVGILAVGLTPVKGGKAAGELGY